jgi:hypothetical protein
MNSRRRSGSTKLKGKLKGRGNQRVREIAKRMVMAYRREVAAKEVCST